MSVDHKRGAVGQRFFRGRRRGCDLRLDRGHVPPICDGADPARGAGEGRGDGSWDCTVPQSEVRKCTPNWRSSEFLRNCARLRNGAR